MSIASRHGWALLALVPVLLSLLKLLQHCPRLSKISKTGERVLILGATSGIGRTLAHLYSERGARLCITGRRQEKITEVVGECKDRVSSKLAEDPSRILGIASDFADVEDMIHIRETLEREWQGVDTVIVVAGVSALQPLMAVAGVDVHGTSFTPAHATKEGIQRVVDVTTAATRSNYIGPLVASVSLLPLLAKTSSSPSILLVSSLAALIPAPTRALYASTKAASLVLYQALSIEHPSISFSFLMPATVEGDFRASAVDGGTIRELDPNIHGLKREAVARRCIRAIDAGEKTVFMPELMRAGHLLYWIWPSFVEWRARKKYNFTT